MEGVLFILMLHLGGACIPFNEGEPGTCTEFAVFGYKRVYCISANYFREDPTCGHKDAGCTNLVKTASPFKYAFLERGTCYSYDMYNATLFRCRNCRHVADSSACRLAGATCFLDPTKASRREWTFVDILEGMQLCI
jgi:hypothetical protein